MLSQVVDFIERYRNGRAQDLSCAEALTLEAQERWKAKHEEVRALRLLLCALRPTACWGAYRDTLHWRATRPTGLCS